MTRHVLVVDDEITICNLLSRYFQGQGGFQVTTATTATAALDLCDRTAFDLVILDIELGEDDGLELLEKIKSAHPNLRVIILTGLGFAEELIEEALKKKASGYISKNLTLQHLLSEVNRALKQ